jgi:DNA-directed RNA polymerase beta subunit/intein/homing endonuclease
MTTLIQKPKSRAPRKPKVSIQDNVVEPSSTGTEGPLSNSSGDLRSPTELVVQRLSAPLPQLTSKATELEHKPEELDITELKGTGNEVKHILEDMMKEPQTSPVALPPSKLVVVGILPTDHTENTEKMVEGHSVDELARKQNEEAHVQCSHENPTTTTNTGGVLDHLGDYIDEPFTILESYFHGQHLDRLVRHQIESYNHFINYQMQKTIQMFNPVVVRSENDYVELQDKYLLEVSISFQNFKLYPPQIYENNGATKTMYPQEAKLRNFTYASTMTVDIKIDYTVRNTESMDNPRIISKIIPKVNIGKMPIMLKSSICVLTQNKSIDPAYMGECPMDCGGYFIIKGSEKTVLGQERAAENRVYCFDGKNTTKWSWFAEIKSIPDFKCISPKQIEMMIASKNNGFGHAIYMNIPRIKQPIELFVVFRALGVLSDKAICEYILLQIPTQSPEQQLILEFLQASIIDANKYMTQEDALRHITAAVAYTPINMDKEKGARKKQEFTNDVLNNDLFPHCKSLTQKLYMIGYMCQKLIKTSFGWRQPDDRDSYVNKRIELTGTLLNNLFRNYFNKLVKEMQKQVVREINNGSWRSMDNYENIINMTNIYKIMKSTTIENGINRALATGDFSIKQSNSSKVGVAQVLNRLTYLSSLSHSRRINTPLEKSGELIAPRKLHNTTYGFLCLTGDSEVLMSNRIDMKKIKDIHEGDFVNTVNRTTLMDEPSPIYNFFGKMPDRLFEITTISGRTIKATADHPFLVNQGNDVYEMVKLCDLREGDKMVIRHMVKMIPDENTTRVVIHEKDVLEHYRIELLELNFLNKPIINYKLKIIARLIGALNTDGHLGMSKDVNGEYKYYRSSFNVGEEYDTFQLSRDIRALGFGGPCIHEAKTQFIDKTNGRVTNYSTICVSKDGAFSYLLSLLGGFVGKKTNGRRCIPDWLINAEPSIKREFLSAFQGGDGCRISYQKNSNTDSWKIHMGYTCQTTSDEFLTETTDYMQQIVNMFQEFNIKCHLSTTKVKNEPKSRVNIAFDTGAENLARYVDIINYTYCEEKRRVSAVAIEHVKIRAFSKQSRDKDYQYVLDNYEKESIETLIKTSGLTVNQIRKIKSKHKKGICPEPRYTSVVSYEQIVQEYVCRNGCVSVPILSIREIEPEMVYDFTTCSENHSFVSQGFIPSNCSSETPEGQSIGIVKNIAYMAHITIPTNSSSLYDYILPHIHKVEDAVSPSELYGKVRVFINGAWVGVSEHPFELYTEIKEKKHKGIINIYTSIIFDYKHMEIRICNDGGRLTRPLLRVKDNQAVITSSMIRQLSNNELTWNDLLVSCRIPHSAIEYIDPEEQNFAMIAMKTKDGYIMTTERDVRDHSNVHRLVTRYTHCEIHPSTIFGVLASCIPFPEHNQSPRNTYQCCMAKQAIGVYALNYDTRMDKTSYVLSYPSRPLVDTRVMNFIKLNNIPSGHQITVAIMSFTAYNQEDSLLVNKGSIDRGLFMTTVYHTEKDEDKNIIRDEIIRCKPDPAKTKGIKYGNYDKLNPQGFIPENSLVENRDVIIAKTVPIKENRNDPTKTIKYEDQSKTFRTTEECYIDKNYTGRNGDGYNFAKVRVRTLRKPVLGDKFSSRAGQKGTCGLIIPEADMPFTKDGLRPDIILNPHAIPSRMTIGQLKETILGKVLLELGIFGDGTSFGNLDVKTICKELQRIGYESYGNEIMYNGFTGEQIETSIFIGPVYYQRLKHMVNDKQHSRSIGPMVNLTRQPAEGRSRDGGFRIGEMERDVMIAHGMSRFCRERLYDVSDKYSTHVCGKCGMIACYNDESMKQTKFAKSDMSIHLCRTCGNMTDFAKVEIPYAYKLLAQELQTINIVPRIITE